MFKLIFLILGLAIGFGGGVYWAHKNPEQAAKFSAEEERRFLEAQLQITQKIQAKLDQLQAKTSDAKTTGSGFVSSREAGGAVTAEVNEAKAQSETQERELQKRLAELK
jgi:hypothetical protein